MSDSDIIEITDGPNVGMVTSSPTPKLKKPARFREPSPLTSPLISKHSTKRRKVIVDDDDDDDVTDNDDSGEGFEFNETPLNESKEIQQLRLMFPDKSVQILTKALKDHDGSVEAACDHLFNMDDKDIPVMEEMAINSSPPVQRKSIGKSKATAIVVSDEEEAEEKQTKTDDSQRETQAVDFFNKAKIHELMELTGCSEEQAQIIVSLRPFNDYLALNEALHGTKGVKLKLLEQYFETIDLTDSLEVIINECDLISKDIMRELAKWSSLSQSDADAEGVNIAEFDQSTSTLIKIQPEILNSSLQLKNYQMVGLNWLWLLHQKNLSGILADEMGLGKTAQVISFMAHLLITEQCKRPFLVVVPASTADNWIRELERWCPSFEILAYLGNQVERFQMRNEYDESDMENQVIVTTYNVVSASKDDRLFLRRLKFEYLVLDEGHMLKNASSQRYKHLMSLKARRKILVTGTPLQNNLQELMALLMFIMPDLFSGDQADTLNSLFSQQKFLSGRLVEKARKMMAPFILRRKKSQVLRDLPQKLENIVYCSTTPAQETLYQQIMLQSRKDFGTAADNKETQRLSNILMQLRKAACHPLLHRHHYNQRKLVEMSRLLLREEPYWDSSQDFIIEDLQLMSDFEIDGLCRKFKSTQIKFPLSDETILDCGKVETLLEILKQISSNNGRVLIFSQFTIMLDVLERVLEISGYNFRRLDGSTPVAERQKLIDEFQSNDDIFCFILSTKAGGFGINLTAANSVIMYDLDFNPHNDAQAEDRAHRVGQTRDVTVYKLITKGTIEEHIYNCAVRKLSLMKSLSMNETPDKAKKDTVDISTLMELLKAELKQ